jgi:hypothetical protein
MTGITYDIGLNPSAFSAGLGKLRSALGGIGSGIASAFGPLATIAGPAALAGAAVAGVGLAIKGIGKAAEMETLRTAFEPLLGGADAARGRIDELSKFAASTPFELPAIAKASRTLETLTQGALSTGNGLTLVGDVASATGTPFDELATTVGRMYDGLKSGRGAGESLARMQELGAITGTTRAEIERLTASGAGEEAWKLAEASLAKFSGSMKLQSGTWGGLMSTLQDSVSMSLAAFGEPIMDALKPYLSDIIGFTEALAAKAKEFGAAIANAIGFLRAAFDTGNLGQLVLLSLQSAFEQSVNFLWAQFNGILAGVGQYLVEIFKNAITLFQILTTPDFWAGLGNALIAAGQGLIGLLQIGVAKLLDALKPVAKFVGAGDLLDGAKEGLQSAGEANLAGAKARGAASADLLAPAADKALARLKEGGAAIATAYSQAVSETRPLLDTSETDAALATVVSDIRTAQAATAAAAAAAKPPETPKPEAPAIDPGAAAKTNEKPLTDRLAQIGGFTGTATGPRNRTAEDTAKNTARTAKAVETLAAKATPAAAGAF